MKSMRLSLATIYYDLFFTGAGGPWPPQPRGSATEGLCRGGLKSGWYASYWNAFFFVDGLWQFCNFFTCDFETSAKKTAHCNRIF